VKGMWIGAKVGLFKNKSEYRSADFEWFKVE